MAEFAAEGRGPTRREAIARSCATERADTLMAHSPRGTDTRLLRQNSDRSRHPWTCDAPHDAAGQADARRRSLVAASSADRSVTADESSEGVGEIGGVLELEEVGGAREQVGLDVESVREKQIVGLAGDW
jgi:hypothetical protein